MKKTGTTSESLHEISIFPKARESFLFQARESFLYIRHGLASVGANNVFAKCVLANCEKRSLLGNCQPSVNRVVRGCGDSGDSTVECRLS